MRLGPSIKHGQLPQESATPSDQATAGIAQKKKKDKVLTENDKSWNIKRLKVHGS